MQVLTFKSPNWQGRHVNSHPPDGVDLCQLPLRYQEASYLIWSIYFQNYRHWPFTQQMSLRAPIYLQGKKKSYMLNKEFMSRPQALEKLGWQLDYRPSYVLNTYLFKVNYSQLSFLVATQAFQLTIVKYHFQLAPKLFRRLWLGLLALS